MLIKMIEIYMKSQLIKCPVCNNNYESSPEFCSVCNWEMVYIPDNSNKWLRDYYAKKLKLHTELFLQIIASKEQNKEQTTIIQGLSLKIQDAEKIITSTQNKNIELEKLSKENLELITQLKFLKERFGESWVGISVDKKPTIVIKWEVFPSMKFRFYCNNIQSIFPSSLVMLLKKDSRPIADGDFTVALMIDTRNRKLIDSNICELVISNNELKNGKYFLRFTNLNFNKNIIFFHKEQGIYPTSFDWEKTIINL